MLAKKISVQNFWSKTSIVTTPTQPQHNLNLTQLSWVWHDYCCSPPPHHTNRELYFHRMQHQINLWCWVNNNINIKDNNNHNNNNNNNNNSSNNNNKTTSKHLGNNINIKDKHQQQKQRQRQQGQQQQQSIFFQFDRNSPPKYAIRCPLSKVSLVRGDTGLTKPGPLLVKNKFGSTKILGQQNFGKTRFLVQKNIMYKKNCGHKKI